MSRALIHTRTYTMPQCKRTLNGNGKLNRQTFAERLLLLLLRLFVCFIHFAQFNMLSKFFTLWQHNLCSRIVNLFCIKTVTIVFRLHVQYLRLFFRENTRKSSNYRAQVDGSEKRDSESARVVRCKTNKVKTHRQKYSNGKKSISRFRRRAFLWSVIWNIFNHKSRVHTLYLPHWTNKRKINRMKDRWATTKKDSTQMAIPIAIWLFTFIYTHSHTNTSS